MISIDSNGFQGVLMQFRCIWIIFNAISKPLASRTPGIQYFFTNWRSCFTHVVVFRETKWLNASTHIWKMMSCFTRCRYCPNLKNHWPFLLDQYFEKLPHPYEIHINICMNPYEFRNPLHSFQLHELPSPCELRTELLMVHTQPTQFRIRGMTNYEIQPISEFV